MLALLQAVPSFEWDKLANLGGLALCVYILIRTVVELAKRWTDDLKEAAERERSGRNSLEELHRTTLLHIAANTSAMSALQATVTTKLDDTWTGRRAPSVPKKEHNQ